MAREGSSNASRPLASYSRTISGVAVTETKTSWSGARAWALAIACCSGRAIEGAAPEMPMKISVASNALAANTASRVFSMMSWFVVTGPVMSIGFLGEQCRSEEHTSEIQSLMRISYAVFCLNKTNTNNTNLNSTYYIN